MTIAVSVEDADGDTSHRTAVNTPQEALHFLHEFDHEGARVRVVVVVEDEDAYQLLEESL